ncbi:lysosome-associated membrane glycoprotein 3 [Mergus octosetaceus]
MGRSSPQLILLTFACAFSSCCAKVALVAKQSPQTTSFHHAVTSAQPLSLYHSSPHQGTTVQSNSTGSMSHTTTVRRTGQHQVTTTSAPYVTAQAGAATRRAAGQTSPTVVTTTAANATAAGQATTQAMETITPTVKNTTIYSMAPANQTTMHASTATNTTMKNTTSEKQMTTTARTTAKKIINPTTASTNQTTTPKSPTTTAMTNTTTVHPRTQTTTSTSTVTVRPTLAPQPSPIPTGTYTLSSGNKTCIKAAMGLQLMVQNKQKKQMEYLTVNPNATQISGSCGTVQSVLNITFSGGFINFVFVKKAPIYYASAIEAGLQLPSEGVLYYVAIHEQHFTAKLGNSFKCASKQTFGLEKTFQLLIINMQLQAFDIVGNQFGKEEECFRDKNRKAVPVAVGLSILGLLIIVFVTFLISRKKPYRGYERI